MVAEMRLEAARPFALPRDLPLGRFLDRRRGEVIERDVLPVARAAEATCAEHAGNGREGWDVLLVVPLVELGLEFGRDVHRVQQKTAGVGRRELVTRQDLIAFEAHQAFDTTRDALRPGREVLAADR